MSSRISEKELLSRIADLPREIRPGRDPWPEISERISRSASAGEPGKFRRGWMLGVAASAILAVSAALLFGPVWMGTRDVPAGSLDRAGGAAQAQTSGLPAALAVSEAEYLAAFREFIAVGESRESLPRQVIEKIETGWTDLLDVESALATALAKNPHDPFLNNRMLELRARQLGFLQQLATLDSSNRRMSI